VVVLALRWERRLARGAHRAGALLGCARRHGCGPRGGRRRCWLSARTAAAAAGATLLVPGGRVPTAQPRTRASTGRGEGATEAPTCASLTHLSLASSHTTQTHTCAPTHLVTPVPPLHPIPPTHAHPRTWTRPSHHTTHAHTCAPRTWSRPSHHTTHAHTCAPTHLVTPVPPHHPCPHMRTHAPSYACPTTTHTHPYPHMRTHAPGYACPTPPPHPTHTHTSHPRTWLRLSWRCSSTPCRCPGRSPFLRAGGAGVGWGVGGQSAHCALSTTAPAHQSCSSDTVGMRPQWHGVRGAALRAAWACAA
jgi:hypothetical protein